MDIGRTLLGIAFSHCRSRPPADIVNPSIVHNREDVELPFAANRRLGRLQRLLQQWAGTRIVSPTPSSTLRFRPYPDARQLSARARFPEALEVQDEVMQRVITIGHGFEEAAHLVDHANQLRQRTADARQTILHGKQVRRAVASPRSWARRVLAASMPRGAFCAPDRS